MQKDYKKKGRGILPQPLFECFLGRAPLRFSPGLNQGLDG